MIRLIRLRAEFSLFILAFAISFAACSSGTPSGPGNASQPGQSAKKAKLNLNEASESELLAIPGMTDRMVHEFQEYRPYQSIQQFRREMAKYVSAAVIADYEKYVYVPISENGSDAPTLQQMPGLDATEAQALIAARPYVSPEAFLEKLTPMLTPEELAVAKTYIR